MSKIAYALLGALALLQSATAFADIPPPRRDVPPMPDAESAAQPDPATATPAPAPEQTTPAPSKEEAVVNSLVKRDGVIALPGGEATVTIGEGFAYLDPADSEKLLTQV